MHPSPSGVVLSKLCAEAGNCGVDVGGTLAKVAYVRRRRRGNTGKTPPDKASTTTRADDSNRCPGACLNLQRTPTCSTHRAEANSHDTDGIVEKHPCCCSMSTAQCGCCVKVQTHAACQQPDVCRHPPCTTDISKVATRDRTCTTAAGATPSTASGASANAAWCGNVPSGSNSEGVSAVAAACCQGAAEDLVIPFGDDYELCFRHFFSTCIDDVTDFIAETSTSFVDGALNVTGGGAYKYRRNFEDRLRVEVRKIDEMQSLMIGLHFFLRHSNSVYRYDCKTKDRISVSLADPIYPFLLVNIGSGVSIIKATGPEQFQRVTGTCIGGGTVLGLARQTCGADSFEEVLRLAEAGTDCLDLKVEDLFGDSAGSGWLPVQTLASSFGRLYVGTPPKASQRDGCNPFPLAGNTGDPPRKEDVCRSLVRMVAYNVGYIAFLVGTIHKIRRVFFAGKFVNNRALTMDSITEGVSFYLDHYSAINQFAAGEGRLSADTGTNNAGNAESCYDADAQRIMMMNRDCEGPPLDRTAVEPQASSSVFRAFEVLFLRHDGYLGAVGSLMAPKKDNSSRPTQQQPSATA